MNALFVAFRKDLLLQWRGRTQMVAIFAFGAAALLLFSFAIGPDSSALREHAAGFLWLGLLLASTLSLEESFECEMEEQALEACSCSRRAPGRYIMERRSPTGHSSRCWEWRWSR